MKQDKFSLLTFDGFDDLMRSLGPYEKEVDIAIGVSGGADSLCLTLLAYEWIKFYKGRLFALTVDHQLRSQSLAEAENVGMWLEKLKISHKILIPPIPFIKGNQQNYARNIRYKLLTDYCKQNNILHLLIAHNAEDQIESSLLNLGRGSGVYGLSGMSAVHCINSVRILRPLLTINKSIILATLKNFGCQTWIEDPSNTNENYKRIQIRKLLPTLKSILPFNYVQKTISNLGYTRSAIDQILTQVLAKSVAFYPEGYIVFCYNFFETLPFDFFLRCLSYCLLTVGNNDYTPRLRSIMNLACEIKKGLNKKRTLAGCIIMPWKGKILICREKGLINDDILLKPGKNLWDKRFLIEIKNIEYEKEKYYIKSLNLKLWDKIKEKVSYLPIPKPVFWTLPVICDSQNNIISIPHLGYVLSEKWQERVFFSFSPLHSLTKSHFAVVSFDRNTI
ncbi:MAG: tRNA lysidine(34) synthetase TilS [Alphaproteobacteria bacterium]|nr:tRNA lysidine(34) synthetase TilS [Alphaproteobacteria bacterium]